MIDLLLVNPGGQAESISKALSVNNISYQIVATNGQSFAYPTELHILDLNTDLWDQTKIYKSTMAWNARGQCWLDGITNPVILNNKPLLDRKENYLTSKFEVELGKMFNVLSYKGRHVIIDAVVYKDAKWSIIKDQSTPFFVNGVEDAFTFLDSVGILNGPSQVFIEPNGKVSVRLVFKNLDAKSISTRYFLEIWPHLLTLEVEQPKKAIIAFYSWVERTGPAKQFQLANGL